jgi:cyclopropane fatty-acyl-phospholipid synthase-like methyltransferase
MVEICINKGLPAKVMSFKDLTFPKNQFSSIWAMNCLLHVPKEELKEVLEGIKRVISQEGLFYLGVYGGKDFEGIWPEDTYHPKRFFSFYENQTLKELLAEFFTIEHFAIVPKEIVGGKYDFQSIILRK